MNTHPLFNQPANGYRRLFRWLPMLLWMAAIFFISAQPSQELPNLGSWDLFSKKLLHFIAYAILATLALWGIDRGKQLAPSKEWGPFLLAFLITLLYAMSDEYHQTFVPSRHGMAWDVLIDSCGGIAALFLIWWRKRIKLEQAATSMAELP